MPNTPSTPFEYLQEFVRYMNTGRSFHKWNKKTLRHYTRSLEQVAREFFTEWEDPNVKQTRILRASTLGYPSVIQAMKVLGYDKRIPAEGTENRLSRLFSDGHVFEAEVVAHLMSYPKFKVHSQQKEIEFEGVLGHIDCVVSTPAGDIVVDAKTMSPYYFDKFVKNPDDARGYITQISVYGETLGLPGALLAKNKATSEVAAIQISDEDRDEALHRAHLLVPLLKKIEKFEDIYAVFEPPPPVEEVCRRNKTGRLLVPEEMRFSPWRHVFYDLEFGRNCYSKFTEYVNGINTVEEAKAILEGVLEAWDDDTTS